MRLVIAILTCMILVGCATEKAVVQEPAAQDNQEKPSLQNQQGDTSAEPAIEEIDTDLMDEDVDFDASGFEDW